MIINSHIRAALLLLALAAGACASEERFYIPNMSMLRELNPQVLNAQTQKAKSQWPTTGKGSACTAVESPCSPDVLTSWWDAAQPAQRAYLMMVLAKDTYPKPENLGVASDGMAYQCKLRAKWKALGAKSVKFVDTPLTSIVLIKAGDTVFINYRGTWTGIQETNNAEEWIKVPGPLAGQVHRGWLRSVQESWPEVERLLTTALGCAGGACNLVFSGHNRGGGLATIAAAAAAQALPGVGRVAGVYAFGGARPGNTEFQAAYDLTLGGVTFSYWNRLDWVPRQPYVNAPVPSLRLTESFCPTSKAVAPCYDLSATDAKGRAKLAKRCAKNDSNPEGDKDHLERAYMGSLKVCAGSMRLDDACLAAM